MTHPRPVTTASVRTLLAALLLAVPGCGILEPEISESGVVEEQSGGCWVIVTETASYIPINLPIGLQVDGLAVNFEAESRLDLTSACAGVHVNLIWIEEAGGG